MNDKEVWFRFDELRKKILSFIDKKYKAGEGIKMYEGRMNVSFEFPIYTDDPQGTANPEVNIHLDCYVIGPARHYDWSGETFEIALNKAEKDIKEWIRDDECENDAR